MGSSAPGATGGADEAERGFAADASAGPPMASEGDPMDSSDAMADVGLDVADDVQFDAADDVGPDKDMNDTDAIIEIDCYFPDRWDDVEEDVSESDADAEETEG